MNLSIAVTHTRGSFCMQADIEAPMHGVTVLFGPSGAGKSTLLAIVAGLLQPDEGRIVLDGDTLLDTATNTLVPARARRFGVVFQTPLLFPHLSVRANLLYGHARQAMPATAPEVAELVALLDLTHLLERRPHSLSGGEAQRVALGRALLASPRMLLLDEPLSALDARRRNEALRLLERLRTEQGVPMLYVTHRQEEIARLADHLVVIDEGRVVRAGPVEETLMSPEFAARFLDAPITVIRARVAGHDEPHGLTDLICAAGSLAIQRTHLPVGHEVRLGIDATDITLTRHPPESISANNILQGKVTALHRIGHSWTDVRLDCTGQPLLARITQRAEERLRIAPGDLLWALVKSTTLSR